MAEVENVLSRIESVSGQNMITETISGSRGVETKATISNSDASIFKWSVGDSLAVHVSNGNSHKYVVTSKGASTAAATADFEVTYESGYTRDAYAIYPSNIVATDDVNYGQFNNRLDVTLPSSYILTEVSGEASPCPMIATNTAGESWYFYQLCSMLRLTVNSIPPATKRLEIEINGGSDRVCGGFMIQRVQGGYINPQEAILVPSNTVSGGKVVTITKNGTDVRLGEENVTINIPLPVDLQADPYESIIVSAFNAITGGNIIASVNLPFSYTASKIKAAKRAVSFASASAFRGYEVSTGILQRDASTSPATYSLTAGEMVRTTDPATGEWTYSLPAGCNPFVQATYYGQSESWGKYYNSWTTLKNEIGADGDDIDAVSSKLPSGWRFPTGRGTQGSTNTTDWGKILFGVPRSPITVGSNILDKSTIGIGDIFAFAMASVQLESGNSYGVDAGTYYGVFLLRDGTTIPSGYFTKIGSNSRYADNVLNQTQFEKLIQLGCLFISATGYYNSGWKYPEDGHYWSSIHSKYSSSYDLSFNLEFESTRSAQFSDERVGRGIPVRLVKSLGD